MDFKNWLYSIKQRGNVIMHGNGKDLEGDGVAIFLDTALTFA
jgi:hypothetical protein